MRQFTWRLDAASFLGLALVLGVFAGCGEDAITSGFSGYDGQVAEMSFDLNALDGGLNSGPEKPNFGDAYFGSYLSGDRDVEVTDDPLATDPALVDTENHPDVEVKFLRVVWGNMSRGPEADDTRADGETVDWSGTASVTEGVILPLKTLRFERGDFIVRPTDQEDPSRQKVEWVSHTGPGKDGILFKIVIPAVDDNTLSDRGLTADGNGLTSDDMFVFRTGPLSVEFPLSELADLDELILMEGTQNGVSFSGFDRDHLVACPRGSLEGVWVVVENDDRLGGYFRAKWMGPLGNVIGHLRGRWGINDQGEQVFVGKIITRNGFYIGHLRGHWDRSEEYPGRGSFRGQWEVRNSDTGEVRAMGPLGGHWAVSDRVEHGGFLRGMWRSAECDGNSDA